MVSQCDDVTGSPPRWLFPFLSLAAAGARAGNGATRSLVMEKGGSSVSS
jgi:hypothetical protein